VLDHNSVLDVKDVSCNPIHRLAATRKLSVYDYEISICHNCSWFILECWRGALDEIEEYSLVERKVVPGKPSHTEYYPTEKGMAVQRILVEIASFSIKYEPEIIFVDKKPRNNTKPLYGTRNLSEVYDSYKAL
jgi:hypothetical protein